MANNKSGKSSRNRSQSGGKLLTGKDEPEQARTLAQKFLNFFGFGKPPKSSPPSQSGKNQPGRKKKPIAKQPVTSERLFIGNLAYSVSDEDLKDLFSSMGEVKSAEIVTNRQTRRSKGFGFITMASTAEAEKAAEELDGKELDGREISVSGAKSDGRKDSPSEGRGSSRPPRKRSENRDRKPGGRQSEGRRERGDRKPGGRDGGKGRGRNSKKSASGPTVVPMSVEEVSSPQLSLTNLSDDFGQSELDHLFAGVAHVAKSNIEGGEASIEMTSIEEAQKAVKLLHGKDFMGKTLSLSGVDQAAPTEAQD